MRRHDGTSMADPLQLRMLRSDVDAWNRWRAENPTARVDLRGCDLTRSDLRLANLRGADLRNANLVGARMIGVDIADTDLRGADLRTAEDLTPEQMLVTRGDHSTVLPEPLEHPAHWPSR